MVDLFWTVVCEAGEGRGGGVEKRVATISKTKCKQPQDQFCNLICIIKNVRWCGRPASRRPP